MANWECHAARNLPIDLDTAWDGDAARQAIWDWAGWDGNTAPNTSGGKTRQAFLLVDMDAPDQKGSYSLPFARPIDGTLKALRSGCQAAASRLPQKQGVSDEERTKARNVLDGYFDKIHSSDGDGDDDRARLALARFPIDRDERKPAVIPAGGELPSELVNMCPDPGVLSERGVFVFTAVASTNQVDTYGTRMMPSTLRNFANDAKAGLSLQDSHKIEQAPWGRSYNGRFVGAGGNGVARSEYDIYIIRGLNLTGINHNDVIDGIRGGSPNDVSVGFYGGRVMCSIDGKEMMTDLWSLLFFGFPDGDNANDPDAPCYHMPGFEYEDTNGKRVVAVGEIDGAHCAELSLVFDGATPGAHVLTGRSVPALGEVGGVRCLALTKAERMARWGVLPRRTAATIQTRYRGVHSRAIDDVLTRRFSGASVHGLQVAREEGLVTPRFGHEPEHIQAAREALERPPDDSQSAAAESTPTVSEEAIAMTGTPAEPPAGGQTAPPTAAPAVPAATTAANDPAAPPPGTTTQPTQPAEAGGAVATPGAQPAVDPGTVPPPVVPPPAVPAAPTQPAAPQPGQGAEPVRPAAPEPAVPTAPAATAGPAVEPATPSTQTVAPADEQAPGSASPTSPAPPPAGSPPPAQRDHTVMVRAALIEAQLVPGDFVGDPLVAIRDLGTTVRNLRGWADIGYRARSELAERVRQEGIRAMGAEAFTEQAYGETLRTAHWDTLQAMLTSFGSVARARFPGGRASIEPPEPGTSTNGTQQPTTDEIDVPDSAYVARYR